MTSFKINRRHLMSTASAAVASEVGIQLLSSPFFLRNSLSDRLRKAVYQGDGRALAQDAFTVAQHPIFIFTVHAKWESAGWLTRPNPQAVGVVDNPLAVASSAFADFGLTRMFGDYLAPLEGKVGFGIVPCTTTTGNHVYDGLRATMEKTGCLPSYMNETQGSLMALHFSSVGTADGATACFAKGGSQLITYGSLNTAVSSVLNALDPLRNLAPEAQKVLSSLNERVTKDQRFRAGLEDLAARLESARKPLNAALVKANTAPAQMQNQMDPAALMAANPLIPQIDAAASLINLGLMQAATVSIANSDPNAGGDHANRGGNNVAYGPRSPNEVKSCVAQALAYLFSIFPGAIASIVSDGGRNANGGDTQNFEAFLVGPSDVVNTTFLNAASRADSGQFGSGPAPVALSNGQSMAPNQSHVMSTVARAAGLTLGDTPYIPGLLKAG